MSWIYAVGFFALQMLYPLCLLVGSFTGTRFVLESDSVYTVVVSLLSVLAAVAVLRKGRTWWSALCGVPPMVNGLLLMVHGDVGTLPAVLLLTVCGWLILSRMPKGGFRIAAMILNGMVTALFCSVLPLLLFAVSIGQTTQIKTLDSPDGRYTAIVEDIDQGALGGDTTVSVRDNHRTVLLGFGRFISIRGLYMGEWRAWENMELYWQEEDVLVINGLAFSVSREELAAIADIEAILDIDLRNGVLLRSEDDHGGFLGDGLLYAEIQCNLSIPGSPYWHKLPLSDNLAELVSRNGLLTSVEGEILIPPEITRGYYFFMDEHAGKSPDDTQVLSRNSYNFTLAVYDPQGHILYFYELDT